MGRPRKKQNSGSLWDDNNLWEAEEYPIVQGIAAYNVEKKMFLLQVKRSTKHNNDRARYATVHLSENLNKNDAFVAALYKHYNDDLSKAPQEVQDTFVMGRQ